MSAEVLVPVLLTVITAATALSFAALGELVVEKSGVLNLGIEGMMLVGAIAAFATATQTGNAIYSVLAGIAAGCSVSMIFALLTLTLQANQVATGLALTLFGVGVSSLAGQEFVGTPYAGLPKFAIPLLSDIPILGPVLFHHDLLVFVSVLMVFLIAWFLSRSRPGLILRAVGESHDAAHALGLHVILVRYLAVLFGGGMAGLSGAYLSLAYSPMWAENMSAGRGWIALALVVFATWRPWRVLLGAYLFGGVTILQLHAQGAGVTIPSQFLSMLPYLATIMVLVMISSDSSRVRLSAPASLGKPFHPSK